MVDARTATAYHEAREMTPGIIEVDFQRGKRFPELPEVVRAFIEEHDPPRVYRFLEPVAYSLDDDGAVELLVYRSTSTHGVYWTRFRTKTGKMTIADGYRRALAGFERCKVRLVDLADAFPQINVFS